MKPSDERQHGNVSSSTADHTRAQKHLKRLIRTELGSSELGLWTAGSCFHNGISIGSGSRTDRLLKIERETSEGVDKQPEPYGVVIYMIPGNPGLIDFYGLFLSRLLLELAPKTGDGKALVLGSSHLYHHATRDSQLWFFRSLGLFIASLFQNWLKISLTNTGTGVGVGVQTQIDYHTQLVERIWDDLSEEQMVNSQTKLVLIGHSVGGYLATKVMERLEHRVDHAIGLQPTISKMRETKNGKRLRLLFIPFILPILNLIQILVGSLIIPSRETTISILKTIQKHFKLMYYSEEEGEDLNKIKEPQLKTEEEILENTTKIKNDLNLICDLIYDINLSNSVIGLARSEMKHIYDLDLELLKKHKKKMILYFTEFGLDGWIQEIEIEKISNVLLNFDENDKINNRVIRSKDRIPHAFCIDHSVPMAQICAQLIRSIVESK